MVAVEPGPESIGFGAEGEVVVVAVAELNQFHYLLGGALTTVVVDGFLCCCNPYVGTLGSNTQDAEYTMNHIINNNTTNNDIDGNNLMINNNLSVGIKQSNDSKESLIPGPIESFY